MKPFHDSPIESLILVLPKAECLQMLVNATHARAQFVECWCQQQNVTHSKPKIDWVLPSLCQMHADKTQPATQLTGNRVRYPARKPYKGRPASPCGVSRTHLGIICRSPGRHRVMGCYLSVSQQKANKIGEAQSIWPLSQVGISSNLTRFDYSYCSLSANS